MSGRTNPTRRPEELVVSSNFIRAVRESGYVSLATALAELIDNSIQAGATEIELTIARPDGALHPEIEVLDNGIGIPEDELREVFEEFSCTSRHVMQGHGLGLAICRRIVEQHGGVIWAERGEGGGASLRFTLPMA